MRTNTALGVSLVRQPRESTQDAIDRIAVDTLYAGRDSGLMMAESARAVAAALVTFLEQEGLYHADK